jgi:hypothetical protein
MRISNVACKFLLNEDRKLPMFAGATLKMGSDGKIILCQRLKPIGTMNTIKTMMAVAALSWLAAQANAQIRQGDIAMLKPYAMLFGSASALDAWQRDEKVLC